jgi:hypothetical protein
VADDDDAVLRSIQLTQRADELQARAQQQQQAAPATVEQAIANLSPHKQAFLKANPQFVTDRAMMTMMNRHYTAAMQAGIADDTPEMDQRILQGVAGDLEDHRRTQRHVAELRSEPPPSPPPEPPAAPPKRNAPMTAPVSRAVPSPSGQRRESGRVVLSGEERDLARRAYRWLPPDEAEREYAIQKSKMMQMRAAGTLNDQ